jgi:hypothetical protein
VSRVASLLTLDTDVSAQARLDLLRIIVPDAIASPLGHGIGQAGVATKLGGEALLASADNGYLAILYQVGPAGFVLILSSMISAVVLAARGALLEGESGEQAGFALALLILFLVIEVFGDTMYGITGVAFWYVAGQAVAIVDAARREAADARLAVRETFAPGYS